MFTVFKNGLIFKFHGIGTLSIDDESDDEDERKVILTDKTILRMSCFVFIC